MKKCIPRTSDRIITVLAAVVCAVAAFSLAGNCSVADSLLQYFSR